MVVSILNIKKVFPDKENNKHQEDIIAVESPLEVLLFSHTKCDYERFAVFMRTPSHDFELVVGFLFTEQLITSYSDINKLFYCKKVDSDKYGNTIKVILNEDIDTDFILKNKRNFMSNASCGICGSLLIKNINIQKGKNIKPSLSLDKENIFSLPQISRKHQTSYKHTGGIHASSLFSTQEKLIYLEEDIGRHNALDKLIGGALINGTLDKLKESILLLSGRVSYELVQKAIVAQIPIICALGAPSSLAVELCKECDIMLIAFLSDKKFNIYSYSDNVQLVEKNMKPFNFLRQKI